MKKIKMFYWIFTGLMAALMLFSGISGLVSPEQSRALINTHLGYPAYFTPLISLAKIAGAAVILLPGFPRLKEWAYAGLTFDLAMAIYSSIAVGDPVTDTWFIFFGLILVFGSYIFYHRKKKMSPVKRMSDIQETSSVVATG